MDITQLDPAEILQRLLEAHGLLCDTEREWIVPNAELPAIRALWHPQPNSGRLDIHVYVAKEVVIEECFAGIGVNDRGLHDAFHNFIANSLHVLLAALWNKPNPDEVLIEPWQIGQKSYTAYIGKFGTRASAGVQATVPATLFPALATAIQESGLSGGLHWVRTFFCNVAGEQTFEALLDNQEWPAGMACLQNQPWEVSSGYYSVRNFIVLRADEPLAPV